MRSALWSFALGTVCTLALSGAVASEQAAADTSYGGPHWQVFATHVPDLVAVDARSSSNVWAVGNGIVHWDGRTLHVTPLPWKSAALAGVSAVSPSDVWAVGSISWGKYPNAHAIPLSVHWDGRKWQRVPLPTVAGRYVWLAGVAASAPNDVWAVGARGDSRTWPLLMHWNGLRWYRVNLLRVAPALGQLNSIDARTSDDVWAAGMEGDWTYESYGYTDYVLHWDGHSWRRVASPLADEEGTGPYAGAIDIGLNRDVWTLNFDLSGNGPYFVQWTRPPLTAQVSDWVTYESYNDIAVVSATDVWMVGRLDYNAGKAPEGPLIAHWNGKNWRIQHTPFERYTNVSLNGISAVSANEIWAVGNHLIVRYTR